VIPAGAGQTATGGPGGCAQVAADLSAGGRWTSLRLAGREWLWLRHDPRRSQVAPGDPFVDAGGIEECVPTVRGQPDHGDAWSRSWRETGHGCAEADCPDFALRRQISAGTDLVTARYRLTAAPGFRFVWAAHALLDVTPRATLEVRGNPDVALYPEAAALLPRPWPPGAPFVTERWPGPAGLRLDRLGPDDGTAVGAVILRRATATIRDGPCWLRLTLRAGHGLPASVALWRNLGGFPEGSPYRSIGVEPMLGSVFDLAEARPEDAITVPRAGFVEWELQIAAGSSHPAGPAAAGTRAGAAR
jgi:hypothetical protein